MAVSLSNIVVFVLLWTTSLGASAAGLFDIYRLAAENDPQLRAADADRRAILETKAQSRALLLPQVALSADVSRNRADIDTDTTSGVSYFTTKGYTLSLSQALYRRDRFIQLAQADTRIAEAEATYAAAEQELMVRVAQRYTDVLAAIDNLDFARAEKKAIGRQLDQTQQRFEVGLIAITDVHEAQAAYERANADEILAEFELDNAYEALREIIGQPPGDLRLLADKIPLIRPDPADIDQWVDTSEDQNLQLLAARSATEIARQEIDRQRSGHYPTLDLVLSHDYDDTGGGFLGGRETETDQIGLQLEVPLYQGGLVSSQVREAHERFDQARELQEQQRRAVVRQTRDAYLGVVASISRVKALKQAVISAESALEATEAGYEVGTRTIVDVLAVQRNLFGSLRDFARGRYDYIIVSLRLKQGAGILSPDDLAQVNSWLK